MNKALSTKPAVEGKAMHCEARRQDSVARVNACGVGSRLFGLQRAVGNRAVGCLFNTKREAVRTSAQVQQPGSSDNQNHAPAGVHEVLSAPGRPLDQATLALMERRFGRSFGQVRIHTDRLAAESAAEVNAFAYTAGRDIAFGAGQYAPATQAGRHLLAHELAHVAQQGSRRFSLNNDLVVDSAHSAYEREADAAANIAVSGIAAQPRITAAGGSVQRLQRAEHGTYVSTKGESPYLDAGEKYYKTWGHKNVKRVSTMLDVLNDLDKAKGTIDTFRIVSHGSPYSLELGFLPEMSPGGFDEETAEFTSEERFRTHFTGTRLVSEDFFDRIYGALQKDTNTEPALKALGGGKTSPDENTPLGIVLRAIVDATYLEDVRLGTGDKPRISNLAELKAFNQMRLKTYGEFLKKSAPKDDRKDIDKAIKKLSAGVSGAMTGAKIHFNPLPAAEAKSLADPFLEEEKGKKKLSKELKKSVEEGAGGPYLSKLRSVKSKVDTSTHVEIRGCNVGARPEMLDSLRGFFGRPDALPSISAPDLYQYYFQLGVQSYGTHPTEETRLTAAFDDPTTGVAQSFEDLTRMKAGEMTRVVEEKKLSELAVKYGFDAAKVRKLNPEIADPDKLTPGQVVWRVQRSVVPAGIHGTLKDFCREYLGNEKAESAVQGANPAITDPSSLKPDDRITIPATVATPPVAAPSPTTREFSAAIRRGEAVATVSTAENKPYVHVHDPKRVEALGKWLETQKFDRERRDAAKLGARFRGGEESFQKGRRGTYIQFLSRGYPDIVDPIFPEDPRYDKHIIRRP